jgi:hypothetical protein
MNATWSDSNDSAFVLGSEEIRKLEGLLKRIGPITLSAECADNVNRPFANVQDLLAFENDLKREILSLEIAARTSPPERTRSEDRTISVRVSFSKDTYARTRFWASGPEEEVLKFRDAAIPILDGIRPWFSSVAGERRRMNLVLTSCVLVGLSPYARGFSVDVFIAAIVLLLLSIFILPRFFPRGTFLIGQGSKRNDFSDKVRYAVSVSTPLSLMAKWVFSLLHN